MQVDTIIEGGSVVTATGEQRAALAIDGRRIVAVGDRRTLPSADRTIDATGMKVLPGVVDPHVHVTDHISADSYETATRAAALGGVTTLIDFAWQGHTGQEAPWEDSGTLADGIRTKQEAAAGEALVDYSVHAGILREDEQVLEEIEAVVDDGVTSFKIFTAYDWGLSHGFIRRVMERLAESGAVGLYHTEDQSLCESLSDELRAAGRTAPEDYPESRPPYTEAIAAEAAARIALQTGAKYYGVHTSCEAAAAVLNRHRDAGQIRAETCTQYLALDESVYERLGDLPRIAPPIRSPADREALYRFLANGTLSVVSTDHVAQTSAAKRESEWWEGPYGANGLQTSLPVLHQTAVVDRGFSYPFLVRVLSTNPAETFGLENKGSLESGSDADIVVFDPDATYTVTADDNASISDHSLYEGMELSGAVHKTFVRGTLVADEGRVVGEPGHGEFQERSLPDWDI